MVLHLIGLGLTKESVGINAFNQIKSADFVFLEHYTGVLPDSKEELENFFGKQIIFADRNLVESKAEEILLKAKNRSVCFLVVGDVFGATTHTDLFLRAKKNDIRVKVYHNASIMNAISSTGLELYRFGKTVSLTFEEYGLSKSSYESIKKNKEIGLHTLCLLDIKVAEPSIQNLRKGIDKPEPPRFMNINEACKLILRMEKEFGQKVFSEKDLAIGVARLGFEDQVIKKGTLRELSSFDFKKPLHCLVIPGKINHYEAEFIEILP